MSRLEAALKAARDTKQLALGRGALKRVAEVFQTQFGLERAMVIADKNTFQPAGSEVTRSLACKFHVFTSDVKADWTCYEIVQEMMAEPGRIPVAVGSGTINDLVKLAAHRANRPYLCVATAASMDGYTAYGASITKDGSKQTFDCPAPRAVVADIDVIEAAPDHLTASGYADLLAKVTAGADWIVADALGVEPIDRQAWDTVQGELHDSLALPIDIAHLTEGLMMSGFAMQSHQTSRPASGAEHQFSHLWDMLHHTHAGVAPSHGFKVGIGTLAVARVYERLLEHPLERLSIESAVAAWPTWSQVERDIERTFELPELRDKALLETRAKYVERDALAGQLAKLREIWPDLREKLRRQLGRCHFASLLRGAGAPATSEEIGVSREFLRKSHAMAYYIRRRFTVLDLAMRTGLFDELIQGT